jgi:hypothetical protein
VRTALATILALAGCGDNSLPSAEDVIARLEANPGVTVEEHEAGYAGFRYLIVQVTQPVDHADPGGPTFQQQVSLLHRDPTRPMVVYTTGYDDYYRDYPVELTDLLRANQVSIEHRFFGTSRPDPADWTKLTIDQMAADQHRVIEVLRSAYDDVAYISSGASKGGMTATYHRRYFPDDVDVTVPYVAPMSIAAPDARYTAFFDAVGTSECRAALRALATEMLANRRDALEALAAAQRGHDYTRIPIGPAVEGAIASLEWAFWQYAGIDRCDDVPPTTATDAQLFSFLDQIAPVTDSDDASVARFEAYYYQAYSQLGYPDGNATYLDPLLRYTDADYEAALPTPEVPPYDGGTAMADIAAFVQSAGSRLLFVYGEWDPWTAGKYELGAAQDSYLFVEPEGTHGASIGGLADGDRSVALARLAEWTGVPLDARAERSRHIERRLPPRLPSYFLRGR